jgi:hypothetical protein
MKIYIRFLSAWALNSILFLLANNYYPKSYVLGNAVMMPVIAGVVAGFLLTFFLLVVRGLSTNFKKPRYKAFAYYFLANSVGIWLIARLSVVSGFGIANFKLAFCLGLVATLLQWLLRQVLKKSNQLKD